MSAPKPVRFTWFHAVMCRLFCPQYLEKMPTTDDNEWYVAETYRVTLFGRGNTVASESVRGRVNAYKRARWLALMADWFWVESHPEVGVNWGVTKQENES